jgi:methylated-DNA-[protein]-cysteine S-methyltransferase
VKIYHTDIHSPIGILSLFSSEKGLKKVCWDEDFSEAPFTKWFPGYSEIIWHTAYPVLVSASSQLRAYFKKKLTRFNIAFHLDGTPFQQEVWQSMQKIPYGHTTSYQQLAISVGRPNAVRAVGNATGQNPIPIIIPCHRVILKNGNIGGYSGNIEIKDWLLAHEGIIL